MIDDVKPELASVVHTKDGAGSEEFSTQAEAANEVRVQKVARISAILTVVVSGLALFSDGYNAQIIGYMKPLFKDLYQDAMTSTISSRLTNSYLIGEIFGMLFFGWTIDKLGRRTGIVFATLFLVLGIILASQYRKQIGRKRG
jgi:fucose permease